METLLSAKLKSLRKEYGLTQEDLALEAYDITTRLRAIFRSTTLDRETAKVKFRLCSIFG